MNSNRHAAYRKRIWIVAVVVTLAVTLILLKVKVDYEQFKQDHGEQLAESNHAIIASTEHYFDKYLEILRTLVESECIQSRLHQQCNRYFNRLNEKFPQVVNFAAVDRDGFFLASGKPFDANSPPSVKQLAMLKELAAGRNLFVMDPHIDPISGIRVTGAAIVMRGGNGEFDGILGVSVKLMELESIWQQQYSEGNISALIIDRNQKIISASPDLSSVLDLQNSNQASLNIFRTNHECGPLSLGEVQYRCYSGESGTTEWRIVTLVQADNLLLQHMATSRWSVVATLGLLFLAAYAAFMSNRERQFVSPLSATQNPLRQQHKDLENQVKMQTKDLRASESRYRNLFNNSEVSIWEEDLTEVTAAMDQLRSQGVTDLRHYLEENPETIWDLMSRFRVIKVNSATLTMFGADSEQQLLDHLVETFTGGDKDQFIIELCAVWDRKPMYSGEFEYKTFDGRHIFSITSLHIPQTDEALKSVPVTILDITELKHAQAALAESLTFLRRVLDTNPHFIYWKDLDLSYLGCNQALADVVGLSDPDDIVGKTDADLDWLGTEAELFEVKAQECMDKNTPLTEETKIMDETGNRSRIFETSHFPLHDAEDHVIGVLGIFQDITDRRDTELALRRSQKMEAVGNMAGGIAHDFNNILGIVLGNVEFMKVECSNDEFLSKRLDAIRISVQRAADLTRQLLGFSREQAAEVSIVNINQAIGKMDQLIARAVTPGIFVELQLAEHLWLVEIDAGDFQDALFNLILNGSDAMPAGGKITIKTENRKIGKKHRGFNPEVAEGDYIQMEISDTGTGIHEDHQDRVFEPFFTTKQAGKGTGLGLAMVFGFVNRSGGHIKLFSKKDFGSTFRILLPRTHKVADSELPDPEGINDMPRGEETILVVDDEAELLELAAEYLRQLGYQVLTAVDGEQALDVFDATQQVDLLLSDVVMPGSINGYQLAAHACRRAPRLKVLLTSGYTEQALQDTSQFSLDGPILSKPYNLAELAQRVRQILDEETEVFNDQE